MDDIELAIRASIFGDGGKNFVRCRHLENATVRGIMPRITGPGVDVNERSERATLFRLRFICFYAAP